MNNLRKLIAVVLLLTILVVAVAPTAAKGTMQDFHTAGDPSQWGVTATFSREINEYEGQHRIAGDPSQWGVKTERKVNEYEGQH